MEIPGTVEPVGVMAAEGLGIREQGLGMAGCRGATPRTEARPLKDIGLAPAAFYAGEIARIDRLIAENIDEDYPNRERFLTHLRGRRDVLAAYMWSGRIFETREGASNEQGQVPDKD